jgi:protein arginine kinase activator
MKCDLCENEATVFLTQILNGQINTLNLCESCAKKKGVTDENGFGLADVLINMKNDTQEEENEGEFLEALTCPSCGYTSEQLSGIGRMGCPDCYQTFSGFLKHVLPKMHKEVKHIGKFPERLKATTRIQGSLSKLCEALAKAVAEERYEEASKIKEEIDHLQLKLVVQKTYP